MNIDWSRVDTRMVAVGVCVGALVLIALELAAFRRSFEMQARKDQ